MAAFVQEAIYVETVAPGTKGSQGCFFPHELMFLYQHPHVTLLLYKEKPPLYAKTMIQSPLQLQQQVTFLLYI